MQIRAAALADAAAMQVVGRLPGAFRHARLGDVDALVHYKVFERID